MNNPVEKNGNSVDPAVELKRIFTMGVLVLLLVVFSVLLDGPVSLLAWALMVAAVFCLLYVITASRALKNHFRSHD